MSIILRKDGKPYKTHTSAIQQLNAKKLTLAHNVVSYGDGWVIDPKSQPKQSEPVTLRKGDYVLTEGMREDDYHAVAGAFIAAGSNDGSWEGQVKSKALGWSIYGQVLFQESSIGIARHFSRQLTISQVITATNARLAGADWKPHNGGTCPIEGGVFIEGKRRDGSIVVGASLDGNKNLEQIFWGHDNDPDDIIAWRYHKPSESTESEKETPEAMKASHEETTDTVIATLHKAREQKDQAWAAFEAAERVYEMAMDAVKSELGRRYHLTALRDNECSVGDSISAGYTVEELGARHEENMDDPENWREGDAIECIADKGMDYYHKGGLYKIKSFLGGTFRIQSEEPLIPAYWSAKRIVDHFKFHSRPAE